jgi:hypothetical protein
MGRERIEGNLRGMSPSKALFINSFNWRSTLNGLKNIKTIHFLILNKLLKYQQYIITNSSDMVNLHNNLKTFFSLSILQPKKRKYRAGLGVYFLFIYSIELKIANIMTKKS